MAAIFFTLRTISISALYRRESRSWSFFLVSNLARTIRLNYPVVRLRRSQEFGRL